MKDSNKVKAVESKDVIPKMGRPPTENTLKIVDVILKNREEGVFATGLVRSEGLSPSSTSMILNRLAESGFLRHEMITVDSNRRKVFYVIDSKVSALKKYREAVSDTLQLTEVTGEGYNKVTAKLPWFQLVIAAVILSLGLIGGFFILRSSLVNSVNKIEQLQNQVDGLNDWVDKAFKLAGLKDLQLKLSSQKELDNLQYVKASTLASIKRLTLLNSEEAYDLKPLARLFELKQLELSDTKINEKSFSFLEGLNLDVLKLDGVTISDVSTLEGLSVRELDLSYTNIDDTRPLLGISGLKVVNWKGEYPDNILELVEAGIRVPGISDRYMSVGTGSVYGIYYPVGKDASELVNLNSRLDKPLNAQITEGSVFNVRKLVWGGLDIGIVQSDVIHNYHNDNYIYGADGVRGNELRILLGLYIEPLHLLCRKDSGITAIQDIIGDDKRIEIGELDSGMGRTVSDVLRALKIGIGEFQSYQNNVEEAFKRLLSDNADCVFYIVGIGSKAVVEAADSNEVTLIPLNEAEIEIISEEYPYYFSTTIPEAIYPNIEKAIPTIGVKAFLTTTTLLPIATACEITKAIYENFDDSKLKDIPALAGLEREDLKVIGDGEGLPDFHDGAKMGFDGRDCI